MQTLEQSGEFHPARVLIQGKNNVVREAEVISADIILMDISYFSGVTIETRLA